MYYGIQSFFQLLPTEIDHPDKHSDSYYLPCIYIRDYPQMEYRGILIDVCRHFFSVDEIKKQIAIMGSLKLNKLHLHLTDNQGWRIEIKKYPELINSSAIAETYNGEKYGPYYYTQDDIREIISYANLHHIEVIPEIEFPGHSYQLWSLFLIFLVRADRSKVNRFLVSKRMYFVSGMKMYILSCKMS